MSKLKYDDATIMEVAFRCIISLWHTHLHSPVAKLVYMAAVHGFVITCDRSKSNDASKSIEHRLTIIIDHEGSNGD